MPASFVWSLDEVKTYEMMLYRTYRWSYHQMLEVQKYLAEKTNNHVHPLRALKELTDDLAIRTTFHPDDPLVILNYDQIETPKKHPIARECRGLTLEVGTWDVVARVFTRFFNAGESPEDERRFDWGNFVADSKEDGSLVLMYRYRDTWRFNTRGSFAQNEIAEGVGLTWEQAFRQSIEIDGMNRVLEMCALAHGSTFVFEFCSPWNKVVRRYPQPMLFLLTAFHNKSGCEWNDVLLDRVAREFGVKWPTRYSFTNIDDVRCYLEEVEKDPTFEGFVLRDRTGMRLKVKSSRYVALHHLKDNGNIFNPKRLLPLVLKGESSEVLCHFPEVAEGLFDMVERLYGVHGRLLAVWEAAKGIHKQKDFALFVNKHTGLSSILFEARKSGVEPDTIFRRSEDLLLKRLVV